MRADVRAHRALPGRVVRYLTAEAGIRQFLDIGAGLPAAGQSQPEPSPVWCAVGRKPGNTVGPRC